jgi:hypothetical protein
MYRRGHGPYGAHASRISGDTKLVGVSAFTISATVDHVLPESEISRIYENARAL